MVSARAVTAFVLAASAGFVVANCGSSSDSGSSGLGALSCPSGSNAGMCTAEQNNAYANCLIGKCDTQFQACYGPGYKSGTFSGPCATYLNCVTKCGCGDTACRAACTVGSECTTCLGSVANCALSSGCALPVCNGTGGTAGAGTGGTAGTGTGGTAGTGTGGAGGTGGGTGNCAALNACCASIANAQLKMACQMQAGLIQGNDQTCAALLSSYRAAAVCP
jgi:hypothetical protein